MVPGKTKSIALTSVFTSLAVILTIINITIPFPILPYLKIDFSEIPIMMTFFSLGPVYGLTSATIYWIILSFRAGDILGPAMKYVAVTSMILGFWISGKGLLHRYARSQKHIIVNGTLLGLVIRVVLMSLFNYLVLMFIAPYYLDFAAGLINAAGLNASSSIQVLLWTMLITGIYNAVHTLVTVIPAVWITNTSFQRVPNLLTQSWLNESGD
jgi:riboflavin transporter FmnP